MFLGAYFRDQQQGLEPSLETLFWLEGICIGWAIFSFMTMKNYLGWFGRSK